MIMEENISISNLNDFIFCPRSIYFHNLYTIYDEHLYHTTFQEKGKFAHQTIDLKKYSSKKQFLQGIDIYSEELGLIGKIDLYDLKNKVLIERKYKIKKLYVGYYLQIYAQFFCLIEMGYDVKKLKFYSISDNKSFIVPLPTDKEKEKLKEIIHKINTFNITDNNFKQNPKKCKMCIYKEICDYYNDE